MIWFLLVVALCASNVSCEQVPPRAAYPSWAHFHWVWLASPVNNQTSAVQNVNEYLARNISVGASDMDSQWATCDNNFVVNTKKFPDAKGMVSELMGKGVRTILWATSLLDTNCQPFYDHAKNNSFLIRNIFDKPGVVRWWHGHGSFIDYTNPDAVDWWHSLLDGPLDLGISGWKNDGTDPYILELGIARGKGGVITRKEYSDAYYRDFFNYSRKKNKQSLIMSRPVDSYKNEIYMKFSPRDVVFSGWVGDQNPDFGGLVDALNNMLHSAWANYVSFGSDTGGYRNSKTGRTQELFLRWAQLNAFMGLFENGGENNHQPWSYEPAQQTTDIYRNFVDIHMRYSSYMLTHGSAAYEAGVSLIAPVARKPLFGDPTTFAYFLGPDIFVSPITEPNVTLVSIEFPRNSEWVDFWNPGKKWSGKAKYPVSLETYPAFHRAGAMFPLETIPSDNADWLQDDRDIELYIPHPLRNVLVTAAIRKYDCDSQVFSYFYGHDNRLVVTKSPHTRKVTLVVQTTKGRIVETLDSDKHALTV